MSYARSKISKKDIEDKAIKYFSRHYNKIILANLVGGILGTDMVEIKCSPPAKVKVIFTPKDDILLWHGEWLDPLWNVELIEPYSSLNQLTSLWVGSNLSYRSDGEIEPNDGWVLVK